MENLNLFTLITLGLATSRLAYLFVEENGPYHIFDKIRAYFGLYDMDNDNLGLMEEILSCKWCFSVWAGIILTILYLLLPTLTLIVGFMLALSMLAIIIGRIIDV